MKKLIMAMMVAATVFAVQAQDTEMTPEPRTLFGPDTRMGFAWAIGQKTLSIQDDFSTMTSYKIGAIINHKVLIGVTGAMNVTHPEVNHGYTGFFGQYIHNAQDMIHFSGELMVGWAGTKDYEQPKSNAWDNFGNTSGAPFMIVEPAVNAGFNLHKKVTAVAGIGYRFASGLDEDSEFVAKTEVTNEDLSGPVFNIGITMGINQ